MPGVRPGGRQKSLDPNRLDRRREDDTAEKEPTMFRLIAFALVPLALLTGSAAADKGGPSPGVSVGYDGTVDAANGLRYVALPSAKTTTVAAVRTSDGRVLGYTTIRGAFGIPLVAFDGTAEGISRDGKTLVLAGVGDRAQTRFAVLNAKALRLKRSITLPGLWAYDALSPDGRTLYATQYLGTEANARYNVRAVSLVTGKPVGGALVDRREPDEEMNGAPYARTRSANGVWAYTLYAKPNGTGFVHALDTAKRRAFCVDLPWRTTFGRIAAVRLSLTDGGRTLELAKRGGNRLALVDTTTFKVTAFAKP
jgi:hypothetical protein